MLRIKHQHGSWGAPKIREKLIKDYPMIKPPAVSTLHATLDRRGLVKRQKAPPLQGTRNASATEKGAWHLFA